MRQTQIYRAINNYLDQRRRWILQHMLELRRSDGLNARIYLFQFKFPNCY
jgi:hypothetical protein